MAFSTTANQIDLNNLTVGSLLIPGREETPSHPSSVTESWHDGVCWTRSGPAVSSSHPGSLTSHSKTRGLTSQLNSTCSREHEYFCILPPELFRRGLIEPCIKYNHGNFKQQNARILMKKRHSPSKWKFNISNIFLHKYFMFSSKRVPAGCPDNFQHQTCKYNLKKTQSFISPRYKKKNTKKQVNISNQLKPCNLV